MPINSEATALDPTCSPIERAKAACATDNVSWDALAQTQATLALVEALNRQADALETAAAAEGLQTVKLDRIAAALERIANIP